MNHRIELSLGIWNFEDVDHNYITKLVARQPDKIYVKGERMNPKLLLKAKSNGWIIKASGYGEADFHAQLQSIVSIIAEKASAFRRLGEDYYVEISCAVMLSQSSNKSTPWLHLDRTLIQFLSDYKIEIDFDIYLAD